MKRKFRIIVIAIISFLLYNGYSQGISRSHGIGVKGCFWNVTGHHTKITTNVNDGSQSVVLSDVGGYLYFFSRLHNQLFMELSIGGVGNVDVVQSDNYSSQNVKVFSITPILFGLRKDLLSPKLPSKFQPYLSGGIGPYWMSNIETVNSNSDNYNTVESFHKYGGYAGVGTNLLIRDWVALNFDARYHFVEFEFEKGYSGLEFGIGFNFMWGKKKEMFRVEGIRPVVKDIYPAYYQFYNTYPLAFATIRNTASYPIEVNVTSNIKGYSERTKESGFKRISKNETVDIPIYAIFGRKLLNSSSREPAVIDLKIEGRAGNTHTKSLSVNIMIHSRNSWNGEMDKLAFFVTADDREILQFSRSVEKRIKNSDLEDINNFNLAKAIFQELKVSGLHYLSDPNIPYYKDDRVQFASETRKLGTGDCDDLVVLYASLLESLGINTAFIEVKDPNEKIAHLYLMFNTGLSPEEGAKISSNEKKYIIRSIDENQRTVWVPIETTLIEEGFDKAWETGATSYLKETVLRSGLAEGWIKILDIE